jgi:hypothetical protein
MIKIFLQKYKRNPNYEKEKLMGNYDDLVKSLTETPQYEGYYSWWWLLPILGIGFVLILWVRKKYPPISLFRNSVQDNTVRCCAVLTLALFTTFQGFVLVGNKYLDIASVAAATKAANSEIETQGQWCQWMPTELKGKNTLGLIRCGELSLERSISGVAPNDLMLFFQCLPFEQGMTCLKLARYERPE